MATFVTPAATVARSDFTGPDLRASLEYVASQTRPGMKRLAIWWTSPPPENGADAVLCVPLGEFADDRARVAESVSRWDDRWLLIESMPARYRDEARDDLCAAISLLLLEARAKGMADRDIRHDDDDDVIW